MKVTVTFIILVATLTASSAFAGRKLHVDSFSDGNDQSELGGWWYVYDDSQLGGNTTVTPPSGKLTPTKGSDAQGYAIRLKGTTGNKLGWDYFGMGVSLATDSGCPISKPVDLRKYTTLEFKIKGEATGGRLTVVLTHTASECVNDSPQSLTHWADYESSITADITKDWTTVRLNLRKDFAQPFWAKPEDIVSIEEVLKTLHVLQWHFTSADGDMLDVWMDDIVFY